jgi:hypothetical protein
MRKSLIAAAVLVLAACASSNNSGAKAPVPLPEVTIVQTGGVANAARNMTGPIPVKYAVRVANKASEPITLKRIALSTVGAGAYTLANASRPFNVSIAPDSHEDVEIQANAVVENSTILGANGPVTMRLILYFDSAKGQFQDIVVQEVNTSLTGEMPGR